MAARATVKLRNERKVNRIGRQLCVIEKKLKRIAVLRSRPPRWKREAWANRLDKRWIAAASYRSALIKELAKLG